MATKNILRVETSTRPTNASGRLLIQQQFFNKMGGRQQFQALFEHLTGIYFFVKDRRSRMICASQPIVRRLGFQTESDVIGTTDYDHFPQHIADNFVRDDQEVLSTGNPIMNKVEVWYNEQRLLDWFRTTKLPVSDMSGNVIGVMGTVSTYEGHRQSLLPYAQIDRVVDFIRKHHSTRLSVETLADVAGISPRQLHRRFTEVFNMNVQEFVGKTRIHATCERLLNTERSVSEIALEFGYCDQSAFTQQFRKHMGTTPARFRRAHAQIPATH